MEFLDFFLHLDDKLGELILNYGVWIYAILFLIIFVETGLVIWPFLPGDSLLFIAGAFAARGELNLFLLIGLLFVAAVLGDTLNYFIGKFFGDKVVLLKFRGKVLVKQEWIDKTHEFYEKYGSRTIILARFVPIVRTVAPFVAGVGEMNYRKFLSFNIIGGAIWIVGFLVLGYLTGNIPFVKNNIEVLALGIVFVSVLPMVYEYFKARKQSKKA